MTNGHDGDRQVDQFLLTGSVAAAVGALVVAARHEPDEPFTAAWIARIAQALDAALRGEDPPTRVDLLAGLVKTVTIMTLGLSWAQDRTFKVQLTVAIQGDAWTDANVLTARDYLQAAVRAAHANDHDRLHQLVAVLEGTPELLCWGFVVAAWISGEVLTRCLAVGWIPPLWVRAALEDSRA